MRLSLTREKIIDTLPHLLGWSLVLLLLNVGNFEWQFASTADGTLLAYSLYGSAFNALIFYGNALWLVPLKEKCAWSTTYWLIGIVLLLVLSLIEGTIDYFYTTSLGLVPEAELVRYSTLALVWIFSVSDGMIHVVYWLLSFAYVQYRQLRRFRQQQVELSQQKLTTELRYLRAQINPHVLFNGINSVYHLIDEQPDQAKQTLLTFSNLLRYQLYECQTDRVPLGKELEHLIDYITLEETRKGGDAVIAWDVQDCDPAGQIAPMLLQPFVENAFKYLSHHEDAEQNRLQLSLIVDQGVLSLNVENTVAVTPPPQPVAAGGGVGLINVRRRLQLIYPNRHQLFISQPPGMFHVHLIITL